jgi:hypothetical protein
VDTLREEFYFVPADDKVILPLLLSVYPRSCCCYPFSCSSLPLVSILL